MAGLVPPAQEGAIFDQMGQQFQTQQAGLAAGAGQAMDDATARFAPYMGHAQEAIMRNSNLAMAGAGATGRRALDLFLGQQRQQGADFNLKLGTDAAQQADARTQQFLAIRKMLDQRKNEIQQKATADRYNQMTGAVLPLVGGVIGGVYGGPSGASAGVAMGQGLNSAFTE